VTQTIDLSLLEESSAALSRDLDAFVAAAYRRELEPELHGALEHDEFVLHYQPVYALRDDRIVGMEALVRWNSPTRGLLAPDAFIRVAEETGQILPLGLWVLRVACEQLRRWHCELGWTGWVSVNLSARQLAEPGLAAAVTEILAASGVRAELLRLELTETALVGAGPSAAVELEAVRDLGVHVGMDDFGTGYASLTNLQQLPIDFLKIDRSFVAALTRDGSGNPKDNAIVAAIAKIGEVLDLETIAEGVETEEQAELLRVYGCPYAQGFRFARPTSAEEITRLLV
jgi:EAL domain-containing protein (putative c-di-GMP-specific phosphodiesterase class I)